MVLLVLAFATGCLLSAPDALEVLVASDGPLTDGAYDDLSVDEEHDVSSFFQFPGALTATSKTITTTVSNQPHLIGLRRESVPVYRRGKVASFKTSYSGILNVGSPPQEFRVVFDTGSGHVVLPAVECQSEACLVEGRRRYNMTASATAVAINSDGSIVPSGNLCDQVSIGFGTGEIIGEFTRDQVCFGPTSGDTVARRATDDVSEVLCVEMDVVLAVEMSAQPFKTFRFDGILGLGLDSLALNKNFSAFDMLTRNKLGLSHFGVFLTEGDAGEESQIAMGGHDVNRLLEPLTWTSVVMPEQGYWLVQIVAVRINGVAQEICKDGTCRGVVDTGTSHLGVPAAYEAELAHALTVDAGNLFDCRLVEAPIVEIEIPGFNISLGSGNYMRRLPLRAGVNVSTFKTVTNVSNTSNDTLSRAPSADRFLVSKSSATVAATRTVDVQRQCKPRLMPVRLPAPMGPKLFILGEPVLHKYYTAYDWAERRVGFGLANNRHNTLGADAILGDDGRGILPTEVDMLLIQQTIGISRDASSSHVLGSRGRIAWDGQDSDDENECQATMLIQLKVRVVARVKRSQM